MSYTPGPLPEPQKQVYCSHPDNIGNTWTTWRPAAADYFTAEQLIAHTAAEVARAVAAERERCAVVAWSHFMVRCNHLKTNPATQDGWCAADAIRSDPQRLQSKGE